MSHAEMFSSVSERLREGSGIAIFPEGGSHDRPDLLPLKAGVAQVLVFEFSHVFDMWLVLSLCFSITGLYNHH